MSKFKLLHKTVFVVLAAIYSLSSSAQLSQATCSALVHMGQDLWLTTPSGEVQKQLTQGGHVDLPVAVSPNGKVIAYTDDQLIDKIILIDSNGTHLADISPKVEDLITSLAWTSPDTLTIGQHVSPNASKYFFMRVPTNPFLNNFSEIIPPVSAFGCAPSPQGKYSACYFGDLMLNEKPIYSWTDPYIGAEKIQSFNLAVGSTVKTSTTPVFQLQIVEIKNGQIHMKVLTAPDEGQEYYLKNGDIGMMNYYPEKTDSSVPAPLFGLKLQFDNPNAKSATLTVLKSLEGNVKFGAGPVWDPSGKRIAFIEENEAGRRTLVFINKDAALTAPINGAIDGRIQLPAQFPVSSIAFISDTHMVIKSETGRQLFLDIPAQGKILPTTARLQEIPALPVEVSIAKKQVSILGWVCP